MRITGYYQTKAKSSSDQPVQDTSLFLINSRKYYKGSLPALLWYSFTFLNKNIQFCKRVDWHNKELNTGTRLWKLNLHYHEWLIDVANEYKVSGDEKYLSYLTSIIEDWIITNPIGTKGYGKDNWNSYCISLRVVAWMKIFARIKHNLDSEFRANFLCSLRMQLDFLTNNLEFDILGNHLIKNWKALILGGYFFDNKKYLARAESIESKWIFTQFTEDGLHEEMSPMYTGIVLEDLLEVQIVRPSQQLLNQIIRTAKALAPLTNINNYLFFNDSTNNNEVSVSDLNTFLKEVTSTELTRPPVFNISGYAGVYENNIHFVLDAAPSVVGPQPGHLQCDQLSFELFIKGQKVFTNSGVYEYNNGSRREYSRSTEAHNTLKIGNFNQSEVVDSFRVIRKAVTTYKLNAFEPQNLEIIGRVSGFDFKRSVHSRHLLYDGKSITIEDDFSSESDQTATVFYHVHPNIQIIKSDNCYNLFYKDKLIAYFLSYKNTVKILNTKYYPEFGKEMTKQTLCIEGIRSKETVKCSIHIL